jgi:large subunit ribosomal protein L5
MSTETTAPARARLRDTYEEQIRPKLQEEFGYRSPMEHPRLEKITLSMGVGDAKTNSKALDEAVEQLAIIAGQRPAITRARKSIPQFKLREGMAIGCKVTLRGNRMWEFLDRLQSVALPRIRDFRGINPDGFDGRGNYNLGLREQTIFPEIDYDRVDQVRGLNVTITTTAGTDEEGRALLRHLGMPFRELKHILIRNIKLRLLEIDGAIAAVMLVERQEPVFAVIFDARYKTRQSRGCLRIGFVFISDSRRAHINLQLQTMKRVSPRQHLRIDERIRAADTEAGNVNVMIDQPLALVAALRTLLATWPH